MFLIIIKKGKKTCFQRQSQNEPQPSNVFTALHMQPIKCNSKDENSSYLNPTEPENQILFQTLELLFLLKVLKFQLDFPVLPFIGEMRIKILNYVFSRKVALSQWLHEHIKQGSQCQLLQAKGMRQQSEINEMIERSKDCVYIDEKYKVQTHLMNNYCMNFNQRTTF